MWIVKHAIELCAALNRSAVMIKEEKKKGGGGESIIIKPSKKNNIKMKLQPIEKKMQSIKN